MPGSVIKTILGDKTSPILYGYDQNALAVLMKNGPILSVGGGGGGEAGRRTRRRTAAPASAAAICSR